MDEKSILRDALIQLSKLDKEIHSLRQKIQRDCLHENYSYEYGGSSGGYDPTADLYWIDIQCKDCDSRLHFYSHQEGYKINKKTGKRW